VEHISRPKLDAPWNVRAGSCIECRDRRRAASRACARVLDFLVDHARVT
jgi:hypothetical protein